MPRRYSHIRAKARREAITALENRAANAVLTKSTTVDEFEPKAKPVKRLP
jgi:hypothetical protein